MSNEDRFALHQLIREVTASNPMSFAQLAILFGVTVNDIMDATGVVTLNTIPKKGHEST